MLIYQEIQQLIRCRTCKQVAALLHKQSTDLEGFDALEGANPAEKMANLQARAALLQAVQDLRRF